MRADFWDADVVIDRFWSQVAREILDDDGNPCTPPPHPKLGTPCWIWLGHPGYFSYGPDRGRIAPARLSYLLFHGPDTDLDFHQVRQRCGDPRCVRGEHLYLTTGFVDNSRYRPPTRSREVSP